MKKISLAFLALLFTLGAVNAASKITVSIKPEATSEQVTAIKTCIWNRMPEEMRPETVEEISDAEVEAIVWKVMETYIHRDQARAAAVNASNLTQF